MKDVLVALTFLLLLVAPAVLAMDIFEKPRT